MALGTAMILIVHPGMARAKQCLNVGYSSINRLRKRIILCAPRRVRFGLDRSAKIAILKIHVVLISLVNNLVHSSRNFMRVAA